MLDSPHEDNPEFRRARARWPMRGVTASTLVPGVPEILRCLLGKIAGASVHVAFHPTFHWQLEAHHGR